MIFNLLFEIHLHSLNSPNSSSEHNIRNKFFQHLDVNGIQGFEKHVGHIVLFSIRVAEDVGIRYACRFKFKFQFLKAEGDKLIALCINKIHVTVEVLQVG